MCKRMLLSITFLALACVGQAAETGTPPAAPQKVAASRITNVTVYQNLQLLGKLEGFTSASTTHATEKGVLNSESSIALSKYVMDQRSERSKDMVALQQQLQANAEQTEFAKRQLHELSAGSSKT